MDIATLKEMLSRFPGETEVASATILTNAGPNNNRTIHVSATYVYHCDYHDNDLTTVLSKTFEGRLAAYRLPAGMDTETVVALARADREMAEQPSAENVAAFRLMLDRAGVRPEHLV